MTSDAELIKLADLNLAEANREQARWLLDYQIEERADALFVAGGTRFSAGPFNSVLPLGGAVADPGRLIEHACQWYGEQTRGFTIFARAHADEELGRTCERAGFAQLPSTPGMLLGERPERRALAANTVIRPAATNEDASAFVHVVATAYEAMGMPRGVTEKAFSEPWRWLLPHWRVEVLYDADEPVAGGMLLLSHGIAGVYWIGTVPGARGKGYAESVTRSLSAHAFEHGASVVILQATSMGEPVYRRIGYREITRYAWYIVPRETAAAYALL